MAEVVFSLVGKRVFVAGHRGMVGSALVRRLQRENCEVVTADRGEIDLLRQSDVETGVRRLKPDVMVVAAAKVGGILANDTYPADFLYENLMIQANLVDAAYRAGVKKVLLLGSSCIYPREAPQPLREEALLTGPLEPTNEAYAIAKIAGIKLGQAYRRQYGFDVISAMPTNLYGLGDNFNPATSHVLPALLRKAHEAKAAAEPTLIVWGTGTPRREFLHCDDCADALVHLLKGYSGAEHVNVGAGKDISILDLARVIADIVGFSGEIVTDPSKPDGTPRKLMDCKNLTAMGWLPKIDLRSGIASTYAWFLEHDAG